MNESCVFVGPTRVKKRDFPKIDFYPPAALGSVFRAAERGYRRIGIIDGFFGNTPSVWHKEILYVISRGVEVAGAASTGALRAAELAPYGMRGIGNIYRLYRSGSIADDDEVCVTHAIEELDFMPLSEPMISIRYTLRGLRRRGVISQAEEQAIDAELKALHFGERTLDRIRGAVGHHLATERAAMAMDSYLATRRDAKGEDAARLLEWLSRPRRPGPQPQWEFPRTVPFAHQFEDKVADIPKLGDKIV
ncbi:MAG TPA: TfuA-like protein [Candidatus Cybelea sp.]|nr:TfuA-like protein [Candidatus Cybelea sp.]